MFELDARIERDTSPVGVLPLCAIRLHHDARYPWVLLVPQRAGVREIHTLSKADRAALTEESAAVSAAMQRLFGADKMNVAALGNMVPQLHVHHVARFASDDAWPGAIWGAHPAASYEAGALGTRLERLRLAFADIEGFTAAS